MRIQVFKEKSKIFLGLEIGNSAIKALILKKNKEKISILGGAQEYLDEYGIFDSQDFQKDILKKAILKVIKETEKKTNQKTKEIFLTLPPNVLRLDLVFLKVLRENFKKKINKKEEIELKEEIIKKTKKEIFQEFGKESKGLAKDLYFLSFKILEMKIEGYSVPKLEGYQGSNLEFRVLGSFLLKHSFDYYLKILQDFGFQIVNIDDYASKLSTALDIKDGILIDIGGEITQIFVIRKELLEKIQIFNLGGDFFSRLLSEKLGLVERDSRFLKQNYSNKELSRESTAKIKEILSEGVKEWFLKLKLKLKENEGLLPSNIYLFGGGSLLPDLEEILQKGDWEDLEFFPDEPKVKLLLPEDLKYIIIDEKIKKEINNPQYIPALLSGY